MALKTNTCAIASSVRIRRTDPRPGPFWLSQCNTVSGHDSRHLGSFGRYMATDRCKVMLGFPDSKLQTWMDALINVALDAIEFGDPHYCIQVLFGRTVNLASARPRKKTWFCSESQSEIVVA